MDQRETLKMPIKTTKEWIDKMLEGITDKGSTLLESPSDYPKFAEVREWWDKFHEASLIAIDSASDEFLTKEMQITKQWSERIDKFIVFMGLHQTYHAGQIAQVRSKVIGRKGAFG